MATDFINNEVFRIIILSLIETTYSTHINTVSTKYITLTYVNFYFTEPITSIIGAPDIYINKGSNLNITCIIKNWPIMDNPQSPSENQQVIWIHGKKVKNFITI